jgi:hypothetical protein
MNSVTQILGAMGADSVVDFNDDGGAGYWGDNIWWDNDGSGWIIIVDDSGNVVDSVFWNFYSCSNFRIECQHQRI